jgi:hypothetical protein
MLEWGRRMKESEIVRLLFFLPPDKAKATLKKVLARLLDRSPEYNEWFTEMFGRVPGVETPPNIARITETSEVSYVKFEEVLTTPKKKTMSEIPRITVAWTTSDFIPTIRKKDYVEILGRYAQEVVQTTPLTGSHGGAGLERNYTSYFGTIKDFLS